MIDIFLNGTSVKFSTLNIGTEFYTDIKSGGALVGVEKFKKISDTRAELIDKSYTNAANIQILPSNVGEIVIFNNGNFDQTVTV